ncbi:uncharacterized protein LOC132272472 [Cornus florida]|uniref:uncharacterized protein LOC132272472 n=1 Tax=Cornus florida TaxID=4283 RepID=UPI0028A1DD7D|nr:uncharacterized protein LOC132272472 [Cornus florida]
MGHYLTDGIYSNYATLIQTIAEPVGPKNCLFAKVQEVARKDVERAFGVLQARFAIVKVPARMWNPKDLARVMKICIILHNMIVEDERDEEIEAWQPATNEAPQTVEVEHDENFLTATLIAKLMKMVVVGIECGVHMRMGMLVTIVVKMGNNMGMIVAIGVHIGTSMIFEIGIEMGMLMKMGVLVEIQEFF